MYALVLFVWTLGLVGVGYWFGSRSLTQQPNTKAKTTPLESATLVSKPRQTTADLSSSPKPGTKLSPQTSEPSVIQPSTTKELIIPRSGNEIEIKLPTSTAKSSSPQSDSVHSPSSAQVKPQGIMSSFSQSELALIEQLKSEIVPILKAPDSFRYCAHDWVYVRYLRARNWNVTKAATMLKETIAWRESAKPDQVFCGKCLANRQAHNMRQVGFDSKGRPLAYTCFSQCTDRWDLKSNLEHFTTVVESASRHMERRVTMNFPEDAQKWVWIVDFHGYSLRDNDPRNAIQTAQFMSHYPERLGRCLIVDAPGMFGLVWKAARAILDPVTAEKVMFVSWKEFMAASPGFCDFDEVTLQWLKAECTNNRQGMHKYWEYTNQDGKPKTHDPRGPQGPLSLNY